MSSSGEEEDTFKNDIESRIASRRIRITKRVEAAKRAAMGEDPNKPKELQEQLSKSRKQIEDSRLRLTKLGKDGFELVTNIRVAGDARETNRRTDEEELQRLRQEKLDQETKTGTERFEEITKKWESALQKEVPQSLHEMLMQQKTSCDSMIDEKNKLINDFQVELKSKDELYVKDLKKMAEDVDLMKERMEEQIRNLQKAYREELEQIERAFVAERNELIADQHSNWNGQMQRLRDKEQHNMKQREINVDDYEQQLQHIRVHDAEEYNMVKIRLETDVQMLEQQLQQMRATYQLNQEKLEYNFQVLKKRDDENTITKSQQKRKITRLQDVLNGCRIKLAKQEKQYKDENQQLTEDYKRITEQFHDLQRKSKHFMGTDDKKFKEIWCMNEDECKTLAESIMEGDCTIHEQQLGLEWSPPDMAFMDNIGPIIKEAPEIVSATQVLQEVLSQTGSLTMEGEDRETTGLGEGEEGSIRSTGIFSKISAQTIKAILELLCDESGFLVEQKLSKLLMPLEKDEQSLMKLDAIFSALCIETEDDIHRLSHYFLHLRDKKFLQDQKKGENTERSEEPEVDELDDEVQQLTDRSRDADGDEKGHLIHPNEVLKGLRAFVESHRKPLKEKAAKSQFKIATLEVRDISEDSDYWAKYASLLSDKTERLWDALSESLEKYRDTLLYRSSLITDTDALRQQNSELRMLLHQYVNSKVNAELEIPPTRVLQLEMNPQ